MIDLTKKNEHFTRVGILLFCGFLSFIMNPTAYTWGEQDMMPFFERLSDPDFLQGDFFTNTTTIKNPRWVYGYLIAGLSALNGLSWYVNLYLAKLLLLLGMPVLYYEVMVALLGRYLNRDKLERISWFILFGTILTVVYTDYRHVFSIARWDNYKPVINSANLSLAACFLGILAREVKRTSLMHLILFMVGAFIHPAMGIFCATFYISFLLPQIRKEWRLILKITISCLLAAVLIKLIFSSDSPLGTSEFIEFYVIERHGWHYYLPLFQHWLGNWKHFFLLMNILLWSTVVFGLIRKQKHLVQLGLISALGYIASVVLQYLFIEVYPVKLMAYLGVTRYTVFAYWAMIMLWAYILSHLKIKTPRLKLPKLTLGVVLALFVNFLILGMLYLDNPREVRSQVWKDFYSFVGDTAPESTFLTYSERLNTDLRIIGRRPVFISKEFPFVESKIEEYTDRRRLAFGSKLGELQGIEFYRTLTPQDFSEMAENYPLDYIVIEAEYAAVFENITPVWSNRILKVFSLSDLK